MSSTSPFLDPTHMDDPFPRLAKLRAQDPVHFVPELGFWVILRHDDVKRLFADNEHVTPNPAYWEFHQPPPEGSYMRWCRSTACSPCRPRSTRDCGGCSRSP